MDARATTRCATTADEAGRHGRAALSGPFFLVASPRLDPRLHDVASPRSFFSRRDLFQCATSSMALDRLSEKLFRRFYEGLLETLPQLGSGTFLDDYPGKIQPKGDDDICGATMALRYGFDDGMMVRIDIRLRLTGRKPNYVEERVHYAYHCGPDHRDQTETYFRVELDKASGHHVHLAPNRKDHIPAEQVDPNPKDIDPREFLKYVEEFRRRFAEHKKTEWLPLRKKT
jgi:hypothetical protein